MFLKIISAIALVSLLLLAAFNVLSWENVLWLIGLLVSFLVGEKAGRSDGKGKNI